MTLGKFITELIGLKKSWEDKVIVQYQYMNWDSGEKNRTEMKIYEVQYKDGKLLIKCGEE